MEGIDMAITASMVKELREMTGAGMMDCKKALTESNGDVERAIEFLRESLAVPQKCKECKFYPVCRAGGCKRTRADRDYCESYKKFFSSCLPLFRAFINEKK